MCLILQNRSIVPIIVAPVVVFGTHGHWQHKSAVCAVFAKAGAGPHRAHTPSLGPAASCMSAETFNGFVQAHMEDRGLERMELAKVIYEAMLPLLPTMYGGNVPPMVWEPATASIPSRQDLVVLESKALHAAAKSYTMQAVEQMAAERAPALSHTSQDYDPLLWFCFVRCFFDAWMEHAARWRVVLICATGCTVLEHAGEFH
ncbi:hypothetical protein DUNSADRAFT_11005 [Dunaliella salina]|uniref:Uncharacterized protein n=1 Tax=Dunaliella salina TaxID=3046 RepID=A0ABQ7GE90_DUNSA|nr:hypothetical protein DUNSADRAFT_11005 [Dunaliella salina]|eukprot:KAF5832925.1 hypothetical protein DUNSADRAFT_11005 [Dunaliella salina]